MFNIIKRNYRPTIVSTQSIKVMAETVRKAERPVIRTSTACETLGESESLKPFIYIWFTTSIKKNSPFFFSVDFKSKKQKAQTFNFKCSGSTKIYH